VGSDFGGADGIRTHDLLDAIEARSQLRHGPTGTQLLNVITGGLRASIRRMLAGKLAVIMAGDERPVTCGGDALAV
jgi:hypothetical protein